MVGGEGTRATCTIQGFLLLFGIMSSLFLSCVLMVYFYATVCRGIPPRQFAKRYELGLYAFSLLIPLACSSTIAGLDNFNWGGFQCTISNYPGACESFGLPCEYGVGDKIKLLWWLALIVPILFACAVFKFAVISLYLQVRVRSRKSRGSSMTRATAKMEMQVIVKCVLYALAFLNAVSVHSKCAFTFATAWTDTLDFFFFYAASICGR